MLLLLSLVLTLDAKQQTLFFHAWILQWSTEQENHSDNAQSVLDLPSYDRQNFPGATAFSDASCYVYLQTANHV